MTKITIKMRNGDKFILNDNVEAAYVSIKYAMEKGSIIETKTNGVPEFLLNPKYILSVIVHYE